mgnify:CR=1 FL=1|jgi:hypothetical protein|tara:strand:- start:2154 stop:2738 length:585 start_codon:yes stop_codon:yes gene_type:complete
MIKISQYITRSVLAVAAVISLSACVTDTSSPESAALTQSSVIAVSSPDIVLNSAHQLSWFSQDFLVVEGQTPSSANIHSYNYIKQRIQLALEAKGLKFAPEGTETDRQVVVAALLGEGENAINMERLFKLYPNLSVEAGDFKVGTLLVAVIDPQQHKAAWRGAIQALIDEDVTQVQRQTRIEVAVQLLLRSLDV